MTPRFDAERLAAHALGVSWSELWTQARRARSTTTTRTLDTRARAPRAGEPLAYIDGVRGFYGLELGCGPGVLVPRPETETLVDVALELIERRRAARRRRHRHGHRRDRARDRVEAAGRRGRRDRHQRGGARVRARNATALGLDVWFARGDLFDAVPDELRGRVDLVVSNPPYVRDGTRVCRRTSARSRRSRCSRGRTATDVLARIADGARRVVEAGRRARARDRRRGASVCACRRHRSRGPDGAAARRVDDDPDHDRRRRSCGRSGRPRRRPDRDRVRHRRRSRTPMSSRASSR